MKEYLKPSEYSAQVGLHYRTVIKHFYKGFIEGYKDSNTGSNRKRKTITIIENLQE